MERYDRYQSLTGRQFKALGQNPKFQYYLSVFQIDIADPLWNVVGRV